MHKTKVKIFLFTCLFRCFHWNLHLIAWFVNLFYLFIIMDNIGHVIPLKRENPKNRLWIFSTKYQIYLINIKKFFDILYINFRSKYVCIGSLFVVSIVRFEQNNNVSLVQILNTFHFVRTIVKFEFLLLRLRTQHEYSPNESMKTYLFTYSSEHWKLRRVPSTFPQFRSQCCLLLLA